MVKAGINFNGNSLGVDSFNTADGIIYSPATSGDAGDVICNSGFTNLGSGNFDIRGRVYIAGSNIDLGPDSGIGTSAWQSNHTGIELGYLVRNTNFPFTNISLPSTAGFFGPTIPPGTNVLLDPITLTYQTNYYDHIICGDYYCTNASALSGNTLVACPSSVLVMVNGLALHGQDQITIESGASLILYSSGNCSFGGNGVLNDTGVPANFRVYCTPEVTNLALAGLFVGVLIAPNADAVSDSGYNMLTEVVGAIMAKSLTLNGLVHVHFDEALLQEGIIPPSPSTAANLTGPMMSGTGQFQFNVSGVVGFNSIVESSTDLTDWSPIFTNSLPFTFTDAISSGLSKNFYRVVYTQ